jgi:hypothetical protein
MIHRAMIEIVVDTEKQGTEDYVSFQIKADQKVPEEVELITLKNYPAVMIAAKIMDDFTDQICELEHVDLFGDEK